MQELNPLQQCIGSPTLQGCSVMLPTLAQCAANPSGAGCEAVLPKPDYCSTHPTDPQCVAFNPTPSQDGGSGSPVGKAQQATVHLLNAGTRTSGTQPGGTAGGAGTDGGSGEGGGGAKPSEQAEKRSGPAAGADTGAKNEKPATKMYCN